MPGRRSLRVAALLAALTTTAVADPDPRVVIVHSGDGPALPALATQVGVHAGSRVSIVTAEAQAATDLADSAARATVLLAEYDATLVVWVTTSPSPTGDTVVVYVAGPRRDRALIELIRVDGSITASELERTIALKIAALLDSVLAPSADATPLGVAVAPPAVRTTTAWRLGFGVESVVGTRDRELALGPAVAVGRRWLRGRWAIGAELAARWLVTDAIDGDVARLDVDELAAFAQASLGHAVRGGRFFATARFGAAVLLAHGASPDGRTGSAREVVPIAALGVGFAVPVSAAELAFTAGVERPLIHQRFLVDEAVAADLGTSSFALGIALALRL
jgi:hypothetical protein